MDEKIREVGPFWGMTVRELMALATKLIEERA